MRKLLSGPSCKKVQDARSFLGEGGVHLRVRFALLRVIVFVVLAKACSFAEAQKTVKRVVIQTSEGGLGSALDTRVVIHRKGGKFLSNTRVVTIQQNFQRKGGEFLKFLSNGRPVSALQVQSLVDALSAAPLIVPDTKNLGITEEWLASKKLSKNTFTNLFGADIARALFMSNDRYDYSASCKVEIVFDDGSKLSAESDSYSVFMLPWSMNGRRAAHNYNADISRSLVAFLLTESANKTRLAGDELASELARLGW